MKIEEERIEAEKKRVIKHLIDLSLFLETLGKERVIELLALTYHG